MANVRWTGKATAVAQVDTFTPGGTIEADDVFILTVTGWDGTSAVISVAAGGTAASDVVTALKTAWNDSTNELCTPITASGTDTLILTADTAGVAFSVAGTTTEAGGGAADDQTFSRAATTASAGPLHWDSADNWSGGAVPVADDDIFIDNWSGDILYGLSQSAVTADSFSIGKSFTGKIGVDGAVGFSGTYLAICPDVINIGYNYGGGTPAGSGRIMIDTGATESVITVHDTATTPADTNKPCVRLKANSASTIINVRKGKVGIAFESGETTTVGTVNISFVTSSTDADVYIGNVTATTISKVSGTCTFKGAATTVNNQTGTLTTDGSGAITTINLFGGTLYANSTGTITTLNVLGGTADMTRSLSARTVTTCKLDIGGILQYDPAVVTMTNKIQPYGSGMIKFSASSSAGSF